MTQVGLFDFDLTTGVLTLDTDLGGAALNSFEFSPNGFYLYASIFDPLSSSSQLVQYDILLANQSGQNLTTTSQVIEQTD